MCVNKKSFMNIPEVLKQSNINKRLRSILLSNVSNPEYSKLHNDDIWDADYIRLYNSKKHSYCLNDFKFTGKVIEIPDLSSPVVFPDYPDPLPPYLALVFMPILGDNTKVKYTLSPVEIGGETIKILKNSNTIKVKGVHYLSLDVEKLRIVSAKEINGVLDTLNDISDNSNISGEKLIRRVVDLITLALDTIYYILVNNLTDSLVTKKIYSRAIFYDFVLNGILMDGCVRNESHATVLRHYSGRMKVEDKSFIPELEALYCSSGLNNFISQLLSDIVVKVKVEKTNHNYVDDLVKFCNFN